MLNFGCQPRSLYREDFFCSSLKLFGSINIAYGFYSQTLAGYNKCGAFLTCFNHVKQNPIQIRMGFIFIGELLLEI